ncbi:LysE family translocator [Inquilinus sp. Marseille-Q2685]|uniref:LysE family translocator n=1 Tax=Inquilinus sp. Marseille-Q2685 TaxID=2866581 RepID=UPI001CE42BE5|nr:LysE family transporter [Inquilinus sp. Marseille-Q2685]
MVDVAPLLALAAVHLAGNLTPGANFVLISQVSATQSRTAGAAAGLGLTLGAVLWATAAAIGLGFLGYLSWFQETLRLLGGAYLLYLGATMILGPRHAMPRAVRLSTSQAFRTGLLMNLSNPYCLIFFGGTFAALIPPGSPAWMRAAAVGVILVDALVWYSVLAAMFSSGPIQSWYRGLRRWLDRVVGSVLGALGLHLILSSR